MKNLHKILIINLLLFFVLQNSYGTSRVIGAKYIPIDLVSENDCKRYVHLDLKDKKITLKIENNTITFSQKYDLNTTSSYFKTQTLVHLSEELKPNELLTVNQDSIYISANYNNKKIKKIAIAKSDLLGIQVSCQTIKELKKDGIQFFFTVIFLVISLFLWEFKYIIFGFIILSIIISVVFYYNKKPKT